MVLTEDIVFAVRDLLNNDKGNLNFSPASRYAVQKLIDYAREEHGARTVLATQLDVLRENNAFIRHQSERKDKTIDDLRQQLSLLRQALQDMGV
mgnify:CR=1 FL=1